MLVSTSTAFRDSRPSHHIKHHSVLACSVTRMHCCSCSCSQPLVHSLTQNLSFLHSLIPQSSACLRAHSFISCTLLLVLCTPFINSSTHSLVLCPDSLTLCTSSTHACSLTRILTHQGACAADLEHSTCESRTGKCHSVSAASAQLCRSAPNPAVHPGQVAIPARHRRCWRDLVPDSHS